MEASLKLPKLDLPRPAKWDFITIGVLLVSGVLIGVNLLMAGKKAPEAPFPSAAAIAFIVIQLALSCVGLMLLGKTAKEGTWWGNLASLATMLAGMSGVLLATALWAAA
jgi:Ni,Fe-hydrogenase I cytochrome b subunit